MQDETISYCRQIDAFLKETRQNYKNTSHQSQNYSHKYEIKRHDDTHADVSNNKKRRFEIDKKNQNRKNNNKRIYQELYSDFPTKIKYPDNKKCKYDVPSQKDELKEKEIRESDKKSIKLKSLTYTKRKPISNRDERI